MAEPEAVVAVTKKIFSLALMLSLGAGCAVENDPGTPGAVTCRPTANDVTYFQNNVFGTFALCTQCHSNSAATPTNRLKFQLKNSPPTTADYKANLCIAYSFGQNSPSEALISHPQSYDHSGNTNGVPFTASQLAPVITWVRSYRMP